MALGNGGTTAFWDAATCCLVRERALHLGYGEFSSKFAAVHAGRAVPADPVVIEPEPATRRSRGATDSTDVDRVGAQRDLDRRDGAGRSARAGAATRWC